MRGSELLWCNEGIAKVAWNAVVWVPVQLGGLPAWCTLLMIMKGEHLGTGAGTGEMKWITNNTNVYKRNMEINWVFIIWILKFDKVSKVHRELTTKTDGPCIIDNYYYWVFCLLTSRGINEMTGQTDLSVWSHAKKQKPDNLQRESSSGAETCTESPWQLVVSFSSEDGNKPSRGPPVCHIQSIFKESLAV